jgi:HK97 family phage portal protein
VNLWRSLTGGGENRDSYPLSFDDYLTEVFTYGGLGYTAYPNTTLGTRTEEVPDNYSGLVTGAYKRNGVIFACMLARSLLFTEARFQFRRVLNGKPGDLFGTQALETLENPWPNGSTGDLLGRMIQDYDLSGNAFVAKRADNRLTVLRPDWVTVVAGSNTDEESTSVDIDAEILGYVYHPGGRRSGLDPVVLMRNEVAHWQGTVDPAFRFRGMSWLTPVIREIMGDDAAMTHKQKFFENGATVNMVVSLDPSIKQEAFNQWVDKFEASNTGVLNAYKTLYLGGGADAKPVGADLRQADFKIVQGHGETRICAAARVPPIIVGLSEGLDAATYSNYGQARRAFADGTMRPLWRTVSQALSTIVRTPARAELWYDDRDISFLQEDQADLANIQKTQAETIHTLVIAGYEPDSAAAAVLAGDFSLLSHSGLFSVQLQPAGTVAEGKGALVQGVPVPKQLPAKTGQASAAEVLAALRGTSN